MKHLLLTTIAAVLLVGCGPSLNIHEAAVRGSIEALKQAIADGADVNAKSDVGWTPLHQAASKGHKQTADLLRKHGAKHGTIYGAAASGDIAEVKVFLANDMDVNARPKMRIGDSLFYGDSALDHAIRGGSAELVNLLTKHGGKKRNELNAEGK